MHDAINLTLDSRWCRNFNYFRRYDQLILREVKFKGKILLLVNSHTSF